MTAATLTGTSLKDRLHAVLDYAIYGAADAEDNAFGETQAQIAADHKVLSRMFRAIDQTATSLEALTGVMAGLMDLTGVNAGEFLAATVAAHAMRAHGADAGCLDRAVLDAAADGGEGR